MPDLIRTTVEGASRTYLLLRVAIVRDDHDATSESDTTWRAEVADPASPLAGLYAFGDSLTTARDALAVVAWAAVEADELAPFGVVARDLAGVHVVVSTCATYDAEWLAAAVANDAA